MPQPFTDAEIERIDRAAERRTRNAEWEARKGRVLADLQEVRGAFPLIEGKAAEPATAQTVAA